MKIERAYKSDKLREYKEFLGYYIINYYQWNNKNYREQELRQLFIIKNILEDRLRARDERQS